MLTINKSLSFLLALNLAMICLSHGRDKKSYVREVIAKNQKLELEYSSLNRFLEEKAAHQKSLDLDALMEEAVGWLRKARELDHVSRTQRDALELFTALRMLTDEQTCNSFGYEVLKRNYENLSGLVRYNIRPIDKIANEFGRRHVRVCAPIYPKVTAVLVGQLNPDKLQKVATFSKQMIESSLSDGQFIRELQGETLEGALKGAPMDFLYLMAQKDGKRDLQAESCEVYRILKRMAGGTSWLNKDDLANIYQDNLVESCSYYNANIGRDVFLPAEFDHSIRGDNRMDDLDDGPLEYRVALANYRACELFVLKSNKQEVVARMKNCSDLIY